MANSYIARFCCALMTHSPRFMGGAIVSGAAATALKLGYETILRTAEAVLPDWAIEWLPVNASWSWVLLFIVIWTIVSLIHNEVKRKDIAPRLIFNDPIVESMEIGRETRDDKGVVTQIPPFEDIEVATIAVRNSPTNWDGGKAAEDAHCAVEFFQYFQKDTELVAKFPRWRENKKPRLDNIPTTQPRPHYESEWNERTIKPTDIENWIDFAVFHKTTNELFAFHAPMQTTHWKDSKYLLIGTSYLAKLTIKAGGMGEQAEIWLVLNRTPSGINVRRLEATG